MKVFFIDAKAKVNIQPLLKKIKIKGKIGLIAIIQYADLLKEIHKFLPNSEILGQVVGCNVVPLNKKPVDAYLYIGVGKFHPLYAARKTKKPTYILNPDTQEFSKIKESEIIQYERQKLARIKKFLAADKLGILVSTKPGQENIALAMNLQKSLKQESFIFAADTLDLNELENFPDIQMWINTSCSRIESQNIINFEEIPKEYIQAKTNVKSFRPNLIQEK